MQNCRATIHAYHLGMTFVTVGLAIAGLLSIVIPIFIHLLSRQRKRPVEWAAMRFLIEAFKKQKRRLQIEQMLLLATRCLILALLGLALARPLLQATGIINTDSSRAVFLVIDNGLVTAAGNSAADTTLSRQINRAKQIVSALGESESVGIITAARPTEPLIVPPSLDHAAVLQVLDSIQPAETPTDMTAALKQAKAAIDQREDDAQMTAVYLLSDFRAGSATLDAPLPELFPDDGNDRTLLLSSPPVQDPLSNVQVTRIEPVRELILPGAADGSQQVTVHLARHGATLGDSSNRVRLRLHSGDNVTAEQEKTVDWSAGRSETSVTFSIDFVQVTGKVVGMTAIVEPLGLATGSDALRADNQRHITLDVREKLRIAMVSPPTFERIGMIEQLSPGQWIRRALRTSEDSPMDVIDVPPGSLDAVDLRPVDVAIVTRPDRLTESGWQAIRGFVDRGGLAVFSPPEEINVHPWTEQFGTSLGLPWRIQLEVEQHPDGLLMATEQPASELMHLLAGELNDLVRPIVTGRTLPVVTDETRATNILMFEDGSPMMIAGTPGGNSEDNNQRESKGMVVYLATAPLFPEWTSLPTQMFMVPLFQETVRQGVNMIRARQRIEVGEQSAIVSIERNANALIAADGTRIALDRLRRPSSPLNQSGLYQVVDESQRQVGVVAVNVDAEAARTDTLSEAEVTGWLGESGDWTMFDPEAPEAMLASAEGGRSIAGMLLIAVLVLAILETILARRFSHAYRSNSGDGRSMAGGLKPTIG